MTIDGEVRKLLDKFKEDTEDLWEQFMEGEDPDPQRYDDFLDNAYKDAAHSITNLIAQEANKARLDEHEWYKQHEVYQLNGQDLLPNTSVRVVKRSDINERTQLLTANKEQ